MVVLGATALKLLGIVSSLYAGIIAIAGVVIVGGLMLKELRAKDQANEGQEPSQVA